MYYVQFRQGPVFCEGDLAHCLPSPTPAAFTLIHKTNLVKSILDMTNIHAYAADTHLPKNYSYKNKETLTLSFKEPFDNMESWSVVQMWGEGISAEHATKALLKRLDNMYPYENLLRSCYYIRNTKADFKNHYMYYLYDPQELEQYNKMTQNIHRDGWNRIELMPCGYIFTNARLKQR